MQQAIKRVLASIKALQAGKMIIMTDDPDRENEGDFIFPAENITPDSMNFMMRYGSGIVCLSLTEMLLKKLRIPLMVNANENESARGTPFTLSIDAKAGITTGVSAYDRAYTVRQVMADEAGPEDLVKPGHIFPLQAHADGVLGRGGHTEGAIDIVKLAGFKPGAVICEAMNQDGTMMRGKKLVQFAKRHQLPMLAISDLITYRLTYESLIETTAETTLPVHQYGDFKLLAVKEKLTNLEHAVLIKPQKNKSNATLVRIHSACTSGDLFNSKRCDCHSELHYSLKKISEEGGILIYLNQEGRGIGLFNKVKAYALQDQGFDTVEANEQLGLPVDSREYYIAAHILKLYQQQHIRLLTNNPHKVNELKKYGIKKVERLSIPIFCNHHNQHYIETKKTKLNHVIGWYPL